jgi:PAS domain S-box-containing protein
MQKGLILIAVPLLLQLGFIYALAQHKKTIDRNDWWENHSKVVMAQANRLESLMSDLETGASGYILTGNAAFRDPFDQAYRQLEPELRRLEALVQDNAEQAGRAMDLENIATQELSTQRQLVSLVDKGKRQEAIAKVQALGTDGMMDEFRHVMEDFLVVENKLDLERQEASNESRLFFAQFLVFGIVITFASSFGLAVFFSSRITRRLKILTDNAMRLAKGEPLLPALPESDEISQLDAVFHQVAAELSEVYRKQRTVLQNVLDVICLINPDNKFLEVSAASATVFGYSPEELEGRNYLDIVAPDDQAKTKKLLREAITGTSAKSRLTYENCCIRKDGSLVYVLWSVFWSASEGSLFCVAHDITARKLAEHRRSIQYGISKILAGAYTVNDTMVEILRFVCEKMRWDFGAVWMVDKEHDVIVLAALSHVADLNAEDFVKESREVKLGPGEGLPGRVWESGLAAWTIPGCEDAEREIQTVRTMGAKSAGLHGAFAFPLMVDTGVIGIVEFFFRDVREPDDNLLSLMGSISSQIGQFIERRKAEEAWKASEARAMSIIENMLAGVMVVDTNGKIESINPACEKIFAESAEDLIGTNLIDLFPAFPGEDPESFIRGLQVTAYSRVRELEARRKTGETFPIEISMNDLDMQGQPRFLVSIRDISERREVDRLKKEFVSIVSHELRTPLTAIRGSLSLLAGGAMGELGQDADEVVSIAERNTIRLIGLINDILDLEKLESGQLEMHFNPTLLASVVEKAVETVRPLCDEHRIKLDIGSTDASIIADGDRLVQVVVNLVSNAVKFSPDDSTIKVAIKEEPNWVEVRITDQGRGVPERFRQAIFERFHQVEASDSREKGGTGLGLAICKTIVERHHGTIGVENAKGAQHSGSTFWFRIPLQAQKRVGMDQSLSVRILICHPNVDTSRSLEATLQKAGYSVLVCNSENEALEQLDKNEVSLLVVDLGAVESQKDTFLASIRSNPQFATMPIILIGDEVVISPEFLSEHLAVILAKPVNDDELLSVISRYCKASAGFDVLLVDDDEELLALMSKQLHKEGIAVRSATTARQAIEMARQSTPGLLVLDIGLPDGDGFDVVGALKQNPYLKDIPLLVYTGRELTAEQKGRLHLGPTKFLTKSKASDEEFRKLIFDLLKSEEQNTSGSVGSQK